MPLAPFRVAVFDMDGTLLNSMHIWDKLIDDYLASLGKTPGPTLRQDIRALDMRATAAYVRVHYGVTQTVDDIIAGINALALQKYESEASLKPGVREYLTVLKRQGVRLAAATATDRVVAEPALKRLGLWDFFDAFLTCTEEGVDKNTPTLYERAARAVGGNPPEGCAVFEDALHCIRTVKAAGFYTVAVQDDSTTYAWAEICRIADAHIASYIELLEQA